MKNLPEEDMRELRNRLANYTEDPEEDDWDRIAAVIPRNAPLSWKRPVVLVLLFLAYSSLIWMAGRYSASDAVTLVSTRTGYPPTVVPDSCDVTEKNQIRQTEMIQPDVHSKEEQSRLKQSGEKRKYLLGETRQRKLISSLQKMGNSLNDPGIVDSSANNNSGTSLIARSSPIAEKITSESVRDTSITSYDSVPTRNETTDTLKAKKKDEKEKKKKQRKHPVLYLMATPSLAYQKLIPFKEDDVTITKLNSKGIFSGDRLGISAEAGLQWQLNKRTLLYSGLSYYQQNATVSYVYGSGEVTTIEKAAANQFNYILKPKDNTYTLNYKMSNVGAAAGILYHLQGDKLRHHIGAGLQYQLGLLQQQKDQHYVNKNTSYVNYQVVYRIELFTSERLHYFIQPVYTHVLFSKEQLHEPYTIKGYRAGLSFGVTYVVK